MTNEKNYKEKSCYNNTNFIGTFEFLPILQGNFLWLQKIKSKFEFEK